MTYKLFVSAENKPFDGDFITVTTLEEAEEVVEILGFPSYVSFDENTVFSYNFAVWLMKLDEVTDYWSYPSRFEWFVNSKNAFKELIDNTFRAYKKQKFK